MGKNRPFGWDFANCLVLDNNRFWGICSWTCLLIFQSIWALLRKLSCLALGCLQFSYFNPVTRKYLFISTFCYSSLKYNSIFQDLVTLRIKIAESECFIYLLTKSCSIIFVYIKFFLHYKAFFSLLSYNIKEIIAN